jgi:hypothetical protein
MVRVVEASYLPLQSCVVVSCKSPTLSCVVVSCKSPTLSDEICNFMHCSPVKKTPYHMALGP